MDSIADSPLSDLLARLTRLEGVLKDLQGQLEDLLSGRKALERALRARGLRIHLKNPLVELPLSIDAPPRAWVLFYEQLKRYSFRLFLRDVIAKRRDFGVQDLLKYCSKEVAQRYLRFLLELGVISQKGESYSLRKAEVYSFGPTLEWFIAEMFRREFTSPAYYGVRLYGTPHGGDYDVVALWEGHLVYVEVKSSPPRGVEREEIKAFLFRLEGLQPDCAFLFNDTHLRMADKIVPLLQEELASFSSPPPLERLTGELFHAGHRLYVVNSKKSVFKNFLSCLRDFLYHTAPRPWPCRVLKERG